MTTTTTKKTETKSRVEFDDLLAVAPANDVYRCSPDDPVAGMTLVKQIAASVARRLPTHIDRDELVSLGALGWAEARVRFDATRGVPFAGFAAMRIRGAILDGLRASDTLSRADRKRAKLDSEPTLPRIVSDDDEVAAAATQQQDACDLLAQEEMITELHAALAQLNERERLIVTRHYFNDVPMRVIGEELGVTESRISQIVSGAVARLRERFGIALLPKRAKKSRAQAAVKTISNAQRAVAA